MGSKRHDTVTVARASVAIELVVCVLLGAACTDDVGSEPSGPLNVPTVGGQSGQEGSCLFPPVSELAFDVDEMQRTVSGSHETMLRWNDLGGAAGDARSELQRGVFEISARGKPRVELNCGGRASLDVQVHMQVPDASVDVTFDAVAYGWGSGEEFMVSTTFDRRFRTDGNGRSQQLAETLLGAPTNGTEEYYFDLWMFRGSISGSLLGRSDRKSCGLAVWPELYCDTLQIALPAAEALGELDSDQVFDAIRGIGERALTWTDGRTARVRFEIEPEAGAACAKAYFAKSVGDTQDGTEVELPARVRVITDDGALDVQLTGTVTALISATNGWEGRVWLNAGAFVAAESLVAAQLRAATVGNDRVLSIGFEAVRKADGDSIFLHIDTTPESTTIDDKAQRDGATRVLACDGRGPSQVDPLLTGTFGIDGI